MGSENRQPCEDFSILHTRSDDILNEELITDIEVYCDISRVFAVGMDVSRLVSCSQDRRIIIMDFGEGLDAQRFM